MRRRRAARGLGRDDHNQRESRQARHLQAAAGLAIPGVGTILPVILPLMIPPLMIPAFRDS